MRACGQHLFPSFWCVDDAVDLIRASGRRGGLRGRALGCGGCPAGFGGPAAGAQGHPESRDVACSVALERTQPFNKNGCCLSC